MRSIDHYTGFEGEPEYRIFSLDATQNKQIEISVWAGYLETFFRRFDPSPIHGWEGLLLHFHTVSGWYEETPWLCEELEQFAQLLSDPISNALGTTYQNVLKDLKTLVDEAIENGHQVYFEYD